MQQSVFLSVFKTIPGGGGAYQLQLYQQGQGFNRDDMQHFVGLGNLRTQACLSNEKHNNNGPTSRQFDVFKRMFSNYTLN